MQRHYHRRLNRLIDRITLREARELEQHPTESKPPKPGKEQPAVAPATAANHSAAAPEACTGKGPQSTRSPDLSPSPGSTSGRPARYTPGKKLILTPRDRELTDSLLFKVKLLSLRQIADAWWGGQVPNARRRLHRLADKGFLLPVTVSARPLPPLRQPICEWHPGDPSPDFGQIAYRLQSRWTQPTRRMATWIATPRAAKLLGGVGHEQLNNPVQAGHDLGVAAVWLRLRETSPAWAEAWQGEQLWAEQRRGEKLPDAFIVGTGGNPICVVEFGGTYGSDRVEAFHVDCARRNLPYQIW